MCVNSNRSDVLDCPDVAFSLSFRDHMFHSGSHIVFALHTKKGLLCREITADCCFSNSAADSRKQVVSCNKLSKSFNYLDPSFFFYGGAFNTVLHMTACILIHHCLCVQEA